MQEMPWPDSFERNVHCILGLPFDAVDMSAAVRRIRDAVARREPCFLSTPNVNWLVASQTDEALRNSVIHSDLCIADGMPLVWIAWLLGIPIRDRVTGSGLFETLRRDRVSRLSVFFFGGPEGVAEVACRRLNSDTDGGLSCAGFEFPGYGSIEDMSSDECMARINSSGADFLVVSLGAKRGQAWIEQNLKRLSIPVISHLGAVVDFVAGRMSRAPAWMQRVGLEWAWRIKEDPGLWRRYWSDGLVFLRLLLTRVVPLACYLRWHWPSHNEMEAAAIDVANEGEDIVIRLRGAWVRQNLAPLRGCFSKVVQTKKNVKLEMGGVSYIDSAFVGLAMQLQGYQHQQGGRFLMVSLKKPVHRTIKYCCAEFLHST